MRPCRKQFSVTVGTVFERSKIPLHKWLLAAFLLCSSKKGISSHQLHRTLGVTYKTAWFMSHRIREAMREQFPEPMGGEGAVVEADEVYIGPNEKYLKGPRKADKRGRMRAKAAEGEDPDAGRARRSRALVPRFARHLGHAQADPMVAD